MELFFNKGRERRIFFEGDSLSEQGENPAINFNYRMPTTAYSSLTGVKPAMFAYALSGSQIESGTAKSIIDRASVITGMAQANDIAVIWAGTNDISVGGRTAVQVYADLVAWATTMRNAGLKVIAVTMIAKNRSADPDPAAIELIRLDYNALILGESLFVFDGYANAGALPEFDSIVDTANATYYNADAVHLTNAGYDLIATEIATTIQSLL